MVRTSNSIRKHVEELAGREPAFARVIEQHGMPEPRSSKRGAETLLRTIVGQQVSVVPVSGAAEIAPHLGIADIVVDITSTGSTLKMNGLREVGENVGPPGSGVPHSVFDDELSSDHPVE